MIAAVYGLQVSTRRIPRQRRADLDQGPRFHHKTGIHACRLDGCIHLIVSRGLTE